jgi:hypothetical protein
LQNKLHCCSSASISCKQRRQPATHIHTHTHSMQALLEECMRIHPYYGTRLVKIAGPCLTTPSIYRTVSTALCQQTNTRPSLQGAPAAAPPVLAGRTSPPPPCPCSPAAWTHCHISLQLSPLPLQHQPGPHPPTDPQGQSGR